MTKPKEPAPSFSTQNEVVTVLVGKARIPFPIHKGLVVYHSKYFDRCFNGNFVEAETGIVELDHANREVFGMFMEWVYTQNIVVKETPHHVAPKLSGYVPHAMAETPTYSQLTSLWILADYLQAPACQNYVTDMILAKAKRLFWIGPSNTIARLYESTSSSMPLRKLYMELFCTMAGSKIEGVEQMLAKWPQEAVIDFAVIQNRSYREPDANNYLSGRAEEFYVKI